MEIGKATSVYQTQEVKGTKETYYKEAQKDFEDGKYYLLKKFPYYEDLKQTIIK
ncbi:MAG: hypothetical protein IPF43_05760 [Arcobacter sp.]|nr:hypothetical protein [Arcobacter sp.]